MFIGLLYKFKLLSNYIKIISNYIFTSHKWHQNRKDVFFDLHDSRLQPYYYALIFHFHVWGYNILFRHNLKFTCGCFKAGKYIFKLPSLKIGFIPRRKEKYIYILDCKSKEIQGNWGKKTIVDSNIFNPFKPDNYLQLPFPVNPEFYHNGAYKIVTNMRKERRTIKAFFSGNQEASEYDHSIFKDFFKILSRTALLSTLCAKLPAEKLLLIDKGPLSEIPQNEYLNKFVMIKWSWTPQLSSNLKSRIENSEWFSTLAKCDFFVAAPGIRMPMCFNVIEAMAVGCIPIIEYPGYFYPELEHLKNCIAFKGEEDLVSKMELIFEMSDEQIVDLRKNVTAYYDEFLSPGNLCDLIEKSEQNILYIYTYATEVSYQEYMKSNENEHKIH